MSKLYYKKYKKEFPHSYTYGVFPTLELLLHQPSQAIRIYTHTKGTKNEGLEKIYALARSNNIHTEKADGLITKLASAENCYAIGVFHKYTSQVDKNENHIVLVNPSDPNNTGTIIRTMLGMGVKNLTIIKPSVDLFDPKVIRASMGAVFQVKFAYFGSFKEYQVAFPSLHYYPFIGNGRYQLGHIIFKKPFSFVFGNEGAGLPKEFKTTGESISIPQTSAIDSYNLSVAAAIALYEVTKQKMR